MTGVVAVGVLGLTSWGWRPMAGVLGSAFRVRPIPGSRAGSRLSRWAPGVGPPGVASVLLSRAPGRIIRYTPFMDRAFFMLGAVAAFLGVAAGAFGAHLLRGRLPVEMLAIYETAVRYQMYHALALLATAWAQARWPGTVARAAGWLFLLGIVVFSGSLYALSLTGVRTLGAITPIGGLAFLGGWGCLAVAAWRGRG
jgi:uncharacterized membrane protein YgdD (TMEM256/DUF423 family)